MEPSQPSPSKPKKEKKDLSLKNEEDTTK